MIVKKVKNPQKAASKAVRVSRLTDYIREPERENSQEKCIHAGRVDSSPMNHRARRRKK